MMDEMIRRTVPPFGTPRTMTIRLVADIQNRLFWRAGTGRASECSVPSTGWNPASRDGQRLSWRRLSRRFYSRTHRGMVAFA